jgi:hypothetical protein
MDCKANPPPPHYHFRSKQKDTQALIEGLTELLKGPGTVHLLGLFLPFLPRQDRVWVGEVVKVYEEQAKHQQQQGQQQQQQGLQQQQQQHGQLLPGHSGSGPGRPEGGDGSRGQEEPADLVPEGPRKRLRAEEAAEPPHGE